MKKILLNIIGISAELVLVALILGYIYMRIWLVSRFESVVEGRDYRAFADKIESTEGLPDRVFDAYSKVQGYDERTSTNLFLVRAPAGLLGNRYQYNMPRCACYDVNYALVGNTFDRWTVGLQLDKDVGPKKCLEFYLNNYYFGAGGTNGIRYASELFFAKKLEDLSEREMLSLCLITKNSSVWDPIRNRERVEEEIDRLIKQAL